MKKRTLAVSCLALSLVSAVQAGRNRCTLQAPVCRFIDFYVAAEKSEMTGWERILYSLAVATKKADKTTCTSAAPASDSRS